MDKVSKAVEFATKAHSGQIRKNSKFPYIIHPLRVAETVARFTDDKDAIVAGILHDIIEETDYNLDYIKTHFGTRVADIVSNLSEPNKTEPWEVRKTHTIKLLQSTKDMHLLLVSCADKLDNLVSLKRDCIQHGDCAWRTFHQGRDKQKWYYDALAKTYMDFDKKNQLFRKFNKSVQKNFHPKFHQKILNIFRKK
ncbi:MAG: HD domain-containing protein [Rickettsiales bacterium]|jgi:(p)ppGpp synthase/HD superfamily hydrolase|nr:HD domain-containing protein [Rickettsiales bacterium]